MRFVPVREFRLHPGAVWRKLKEEQELVLTSRGKPMGLLTPLDEASFERTLRAWRQARGLEALAGLQEEAKKRGLDRLSPAEIDAEILRIRSGKRSGPSA